MHSNPRDHTVQYMSNTATPDVVDHLYQDRHLFQRIKTLELVHSSNLVTKTNCKMNYPEIPIPNFVCGSIKTLPAYKVVDSALFPQELKSRDFSKKGVGTSNVNKIHKTT